MKTQKLHDGTLMPAFGLGTWKSDSEEVYRAVRTAIELGYRHIDCAAIYQNEQDVGRAIADAIQAGDVNRQHLWVTSKLWNDAHAPKDVRPALEKSLRRLQLDYLDLYLIHWPVALRLGVLFPQGPEDLVPIGELPLESTWEAMLQAASLGLTHQVGVSNFNVPKIKQIQKATGKTPAVNQIELHPYLQQTELVTGCAELGVAVTAYSPLGSPDSAAMMGRSDTVPLIKHPTIVEIAQEHGATPGQILIAWALARGTSVIPKSVNPSRIAENLGGCDVALSEADMAAIAELDQHKRMIEGSFWFLGEVYTATSLWDE